MTKEISVVVFKPFNKAHTQHTKEYMVVVDPTEYNKWKAGDKTIPLVQVVDGMLLFASDTGSQGQWRTPSAGEVASDFDDFNADGSVKEGVYDATKKPEDEALEDDAPKGRKAKKVATETAIQIVLERGKYQLTKAIGTGGYDMQPSKGSGVSTGHIGTSGR
ncbi:hypothetical protein NliqN6_5651 [Naganishia liquefaciens]|uniref:Ribosome maturation protein SDO1/SBDS N-terminal domain-containing protein n=1 Tax=Naganishia liquefaciens TaxID=104408 RepID=A0A8H3TY41_9TREE|nr:hypothetical protein NliqN6_5651 [Naganishia liquefaciens]